MANIIILFALITMVFTYSPTFAFDPSPLQDFCVADRANSVKVNGFVCKDPNMAKPSDFSFSGLDKVGNISKTTGSAVTPVNVAHIAGLNTQGISLARIDFALYGINPPHTHPRGSEILTVLEGTLYVGFVTSNTENRLITKVLKKGDAFVFPIGLIHFQANVGHGNAVALAALSSQNPGRKIARNVVAMATGDAPAEVATTELPEIFKTIQEGVMRGYNLKWR